MGEEETQTDMSGRREPSLKATRPLMDHIQLVWPDCDQCQRKGKVWSLFPGNWAIMWDTQPTPQSKHEPS